MGSPLVFLLLLVGLVVDSNALADPPKFVAALKDLPKPAVIIQEDLRKESSTDKKIIVAFDLHGVFTQETQPSLDGKVTLNNRFIRTLRLATKNNAQTLLVSAHDLPDILRRELQSLRYGDDKDQVLYIDFTRSEPKNEKGLLYLPFANGEFRVIEFAIDGNITSARTPGAKYYVEKAAAVLIRQLSPEGLKLLTLPSQHYEKVLSSANELTEELSGRILVAQDKYLPKECVSWTTAPNLRNFSLEQWHQESNEDAFLEKLNDFLEKSICAREKAGRRTYPFGKPTKDNKASVKSDLREVVTRLLGSRKLLTDSLSVESIRNQVQHLRKATREKTMFFVDDSYANVEKFQNDIQRSGYFEDSTVYLEFAQDPQKDKQPSIQELQKSLDKDALKKSN